MKYLLNNALDEKVVEFIQTSISRSYKVKSIHFTNKCIDVDFLDNISFSDFSKMIKELLYISKNINKDKLFEQTSDSSYQENPMKYLESSKDVIKIADGLYMFQGTFWKIFKSCHAYVQRLASKYNATEQEYPTLWPVDLYKKINYFKEFPQQVLLATGLKENFHNKNKFSESYAKNRDYNSVKVDNSFDDFKFGLEQAVCDTCYYALSNEIDFQNKIYTCYNKVFRNETSKINSLDRLINFSVRDIMAVGDKNFVLKIRQNLIDDVIEMMKYYGLEGKIETANDPFFANDSAMKNIFQYTSRLKYEILARLPFSNSYIAVGSINLHLDFFGNAFNITLPDGSYVYSGCLGIGFERFVYSLYCQNGHDVNKWPVDLKEKIGIE